jgi:Eco57I restriction-modification methylase
MNDKFTFKLQGRNPDVLNSIANLSSDEVFTPPSFANSMLDQIELAWAEANDGEVIWSNPKIRFLDPFSKSGVFLREIVKRLTSGLEMHMPDLQQRIDHILTKQVFGVATTTLTALLSRRTVYCSKDATGKHSITSKFKSPHGNIWFEPGSHDWQGGTIREITVDEDGNEVEIFADARCGICGANRRDFDRAEGLELHAYSFIHTSDIKNWTEKAFGENMQFDVIVGNPPYQLDDGGYGTSAGAIYNMFVSQAKKLNPRYLTMVIPARWFSGGKGLDQFRDEMINDDRIRVIHDFPDSSEVFPGVQIKGGVCFFLWDRDNRGLAKVVTHDKGAQISFTERPLVEKGSDVFIRYNEGVEILKQVISHETGGGQEELVLLLQGNKSFKNHVSSSKPFGFRTFFQGTKIQKEGDVLIHQNGGKGFVSRSDVSKNQQLIDTWKVFIPAAGSGSDAFPHMILGKPFLGKPGEISSETYNCIGPFASETEAKNVISYVTTRFFRFLVLLHKPSQHATQSVYTFVPNQDFSIPWTDEMLYKKYRITKSQVDFIDSMVRSMELDNE